jgi:hypothetical protein
MNQASTQQELCHYIRLDNGVHSFLFEDSSRACFDQFMERLTAVTEASSPDKPLLVLLDWRKSGLPPLRYAFQKSQVYMKRFPHYSGGKTAYLYRMGTLITLAQSFVNLLHAKASGRFFAEDQQDAAIKWLLEN